MRSSGKNQIFITYLYRGIIRSKKRNDKSHPLILFFYLIDDSEIITLTNITNNVRESQCAKRIRGIMLQSMM